MLHRFILFSFTLLMATAVQAQGIKFFKGSFDEAKAMAKKTGKPIFMDAYASWCGPCKRMAANVFTQEKVGDFFNQNFVNLKIDMEKGEGVELRRKYGVSAYPTLLFLNADGSVINSVRGARGANGLIELGKQAAVPKEDELLKMTKRYEDGDRDPAFLYEYYNALQLTGDARSQEVYSELMVNIPDDKVAEKPYADLIYSDMGMAGTSSFNKVAENKDAFADIYGEDDVKSRLSSGIESKVKASGEAQDKAGLKIAIKAAKKVGFDDFKRRKFLYKTLYAGAGRDWDAYTKSVDKYLGKFAANDADAYNDVAWNFYALVDDPKWLQKAEGYARKAIEMEPMGKYYRTLSFLLMKQEKYSEAADYAEQAIAAFGEDSEEGKQLKSLPKALRSRAGQ